MITIFMEYFYWHYFVAPFEILRIMQNYMHARWHQFLIVQHFKTLFSPWHRQNPSDFGPKYRTFSDRILDFLADIYIRLIAAGIRLIIIFAGFIVQLATLIFFLVLFVVWLAWPFLAMYSIYLGLNMINLISPQI
jgi:hypothetical protein